MYKVFIKWIVRHEGFLQIEQRLIKKITYLYNKISILSVIKSLKLLRSFYFMLKIYLEHHNDFNGRSGLTKQCIPSTTDYFIIFDLLNYLEDPSIIKNKKYPKSQLKLDVDYIYKKIAVK